MYKDNQDDQSTPRRVLPADWAVTATRFSANWQVTATLLLNDLDLGLEAHSTLNVAPPQPAMPAFPSFFALLEAETAAEEATANFLE